MTLFKAMAILLLSTSYEDENDVKLLKLKSISIGDGIDAVFNEFDDTKVLNNELSGISGHKIIFAKVTNDSCASFSSQNRRIYEFRFLVKRRGATEEQLVSMMEKADSNVASFFKKNQNTKVKDGYVIGKTFEYPQANRFISIEIFPDYSILTVTDTKKGFEIVKSVARPGGRAPAP